MSTNTTDAEVVGTAPHGFTIPDDTTLINEMERLRVVVRPQVGGCWCFEDEDGEWNGVGYDSWREAAYRALNDADSRTYPGHCRTCGTLARIPDGEECGPCFDISHPWPEDNR